MLGERTSLGIAQTAFYAPAVPLAIFLFIRNGKTRPRMAWWPFISLTLMRLAGGIITIILEQNPKNLGLIIAALILLNVGAVPLIIATLGQMRIILMDNYSHSPHSNRIAKGLRLFFIAAIALLAAGGGVSSVNKSLARILTLVGYVVFAVMLAILITMELYFLRKRSELIPTSRKVLKTSLIAAPLLVIRTIYGILEVADENSTHSIWNPLYGNIYAFCFMCLFVEYIVVCIYFWLGLSIPPDRGVANVPEGDERYIQK